MKKLNFLCLWLVFLLCLSGCVTIQMNEDESMVVAPQTVYTPQATAPVATQAPTQAPVGNANAAAWTKAEIIAFLNNAFQLAKSDTAAYNLKETITHSVSLMHISSSQMESMAQEVLSKVNRSTETEYTVAGGIAAANGVSVPVNDLIPPAGEAYVLQETDIAAARASFDGENVIIVLSFVEDSASAEAPIPSILGKKVPYISLNGQDISPYSLQSAQLQYSEITLAAGIDGQGRLVTVTVTATAAGSAVGGIGVMTAEVLFGGTLKETRVFTYS